MAFGKALCIQKYTEASIIVRGEETKARKEEIKKIPGYKFAFYEGAAGWMFPATKEAEVRRVLGINTPYVGGMKCASTPEPAQNEPRPEYKKAAAPRGKLRSTVTDPEEAGTPPPTAESSGGKSPMEQIVVLIGGINEQLTKIFDRLDNLDAKVEAIREKMVQLTTEEATEEVTEEVESE